MALLQIAALLVVLSALLGWINHVYVGLPHAIGLLLMGLAGSLCLIAADALVPGLGLAAALHAAVSQVDFFETVMNGMLSFLLFAAALHVDARALQSQKAPVILMATVSVLISTAIIGFGLWWIADLAGFSIPLPWALVFGALISPTDPVAVLSVLKNVKVPKSLEAKIAGEALFNDGVGVVTFTVLLAVALAAYGIYPAPGQHEVVTPAGGMDLFAVAQVFAVEVFGAIALGVTAGFVALAMIRKANDPAIRTLISLALVLGTYVLAASLHLSGPIAVVIPGLIIGDWGANNAISQRAKYQLFPFWTMIDEILNSVLFLLIGLEVLVIRFEASHVVAAVLCIPLALVARFVSVAVPVTALRAMGNKATEGAIRIMTWGGVRGGISVALALSLPETTHKATILTATYVVVVFSIVVQGLTIGPVIRTVRGCGRGCVTD